MQRPKTIRRVPRRPLPPLPRMETGASRIMATRMLSHGADDSLERKGWWHRIMPPRDPIASLDRMITMMILAGLAICIWLVILWCAWHIVPKLLGLG